MGLKLICLSPNTLGVPGGVGLKISSFDAGEGVHVDNRGTGLLLEFCNAGRAHLLPIYPAVSGHIDCNRLIGGFQRVAEHTRSHYQAGRIGRAENRLRLICSVKLELLSQVKSASSVLQHKTKLSHYR